jgi:hypothetical protein
MKIGTVIIAVAVLLGTGIGQAFAQQTHDFQTWTMATLNKSLSPQYRLYLEAQPRYGDDSTRSNALLLRSAVGYNLRPNVSVWLGYGQIYFYVPRKVEERRVYQQLLITNRYPGFDLANRTRLEQRLLPNTDTVYRLRHQVRGFVPLVRDRSWAVVAHNELFWNLNGVTPAIRSGYDQNRTFLGVSRGVNKNARFEIGYQYVHIRVPTAAPDRHWHTLLTMFNFVY